MGSLRIYSYLFSSRNEELINTSPFSTLSASLAILLSLLSWQFELHRARCFYSWFYRNSSI